MSFWNFWIFFEITIYVLGGVYLVKLFHWSTPLRIFCFLVLLGGPLMVIFEFFEILYTIFEIRIYDFGGVNLVKKFHWSTPSWFFILLVFLEGPFYVISEFLNFQLFLKWEYMTFGGLFSEQLSLKFCFLVLLEGPFWALFNFLKFSKLFMI